MLLNGSSHSWFLSSFVMKPAKCPNQATTHLCIVLFFRALLFLFWGFFFSPPFYADFTTVYKSHMLRPQSGTVISSSGVLTPKGTRFYLSRGSGWKPDRGDMTPAPRLSVLQWLIPPSSEVKRGLEAVWITCCNWLERSLLHCTTSVHCFVIELNFIRFKYRLCSVEA